MKKVLLALGLILSMNTFSAELVTCKIEGTTQKNVIVPDREVINSIINVLNSSKNEIEKIKTIKSALYIDAISIGDGKSFCDLASKNYSVDQEKCVKLLKSTDFANQILIENELNPNKLACMIGMNAKVILGFKM